MKRVDEFFTNEIRTCAIAGHVNPDGDCVGSTTALYLYIRRNFPWIDVKLYLERPKEALMFLPGLGGAAFEKPAAERCDLFVTCDVSSLDRIGMAGELFDMAYHTLCVDHHVSNPGFAENNIIDAEASSCAEVLFYIMDEKKIDREIAESLFTGIIHDSGVFQYQNTRPETLEAAAALIRKGVAFSKIIEDSFNIRTYVQNRILGYVLSESRLYAEGRICVGSVTFDEMRRFEATKKDLDVIVSQLRLTQGAEAAVFLYQTDDDEFKASLRSNSYLDVAAVAGRFGGGGHVRAAGCTIKGDLKSVEKMVVEAVRADLK